MTNRWLRRSAILALLLIWLAVMSFPFLAIALAARGQVQFGSAQERHVRLFLIQERAANGIGIERTRPLRDATGCFHNRVTYLLWQGSGQNASYCQCIDETSGALLPAPANTCPES